MCRLYDEIMEKQSELEYYNSCVKKRDILNAAANKLELLAQAIRDENKELFDDLAFNADGRGVRGAIGVIANVDLDEVHSIIFGAYNGN